MTAGAKMRLVGKKLGGNYETRILDSLTYDNSYDNI